MMGKKKEKWAQFVEAMNGKLRFPFFSAAWEKVIENGAWIACPRNAISPGFFFIF